MADFLDNFLNNITMYRLLLYYLIGLLVFAVLLSLLGVLSFSPLAIVLSTGVILASSMLTNYIFAKVFEAPRNFESVYITALILSLIITPTTALHSLPFLVWAGVLANASKYILALNKKHIFNPVAVSVFITALTVNQSARWWVGTGFMLPLVIIGGVLIVRKISRQDLVFSFLFMALLTSLGAGALNGSDIVSLAKQIIFDSPLFFLAFVMLTEPLTTPPTKKLQIIYGGIVGFLFAPQLHLGGFYGTPELALLIGNLYSFSVSLKQKLVLTLKERIEIGPNMFDFVFQKNKNFDFLPGQYLEWTLEHSKQDSRGSRRYFTVASSPTEKEVRAGIKLYENSSSFKKALVDLPQGGKIVASSLFGDFTLPKDKDRKLVFIAGGIGITPFRSMIKYLIDKGERRDLILFYSNREENEILYREVFDAAEKELGIKVNYILTRIDGRIDEKMVKETVPDFTERYFYISGPLNMVTSFKQVLLKLKIKNNQIITDYFPGFRS